MAIALKKQYCVGRERMKASDLLVKCLEEEGVEFIYGVPGEENLDML